jgi:hypothetical protein
LKSPRIGIVIAALVTFPVMVAVAALGAIVIIVALEADARISKPARALKIARAP